MSTETELREWRYGPTQAERLAAAILRLESYQNIEPQSPLGGPDSGADILCDRGSVPWVAAVYFPTTGQSFPEIKEKFEHDLAGATKRNRRGIIFLTNQRLTRGERQALLDIAARSKQECIVYDVERIAGALNSPEGYGVRVAYLRLTMSPEEQIAFFANRENLLTDAISTNTDQIRSLAAEIARLSEGQMHVAQTIDALSQFSGLIVEPLRAFDPLAAGEIIAGSANGPLTARITPEMILFAHRLVCFELPPRIIGRFRSEAVVLQRASGAPSEPTLSPPPPNEVPKLVTELCEFWRRQYPHLDSDEKKLEAAAEFFHRIIAIHPFRDGNGRVGRSLLLQQCIELFGHVDMSRFGRGADYYGALQAGDSKNLAPLIELIRQAVFG